MKAVPYTEGVVETSPGQAPRAALGLLSRKAWANGRLQRRVNQNLERHLTLLRQKHCHPIHERVLG